MGFRGQTYRVQLFAAVILSCSLVAPSSTFAAPHDDCETNFIAYLGQDAYRFSTRHAGALASVRLFSVLSYAKAASLGMTGNAHWRLRIVGPDPSPRTVKTARGTAALDAQGRANVEILWDGRNDAGRVVADGTYQYTFEARFVSKLHRAARTAKRYEDLDAEPGSEEAYASSRQVVVDSAMAPSEARSTRDTLRMSACEIQQNAPLETGFGYNYYYGSLHSHSSYTDGGHPTTSCSSSIGTGTFDPTAIYDFARNTAGMDFWGVIDHNHLFENALASPTEALVRQRYADGLAAAQAASQDGAFVALWGMEWGVTTNADQGHVTLLETPALFGWETCTNCNGPNPECTPGVNCYFDVFTPKRFGYLTMYARSVENPSPAGALGVFCHPSSGQFDNYAFDANADAAMQGVAVRSGLAFTTASDCSDANVATTDYFVRWRDALSRGFHVGPVADHDAHCNNYGVAIPNRTVYLLPNNISPALTKARVLQAHKARHFYASEDANAQLVFGTSDGQHIMGDVFSVGTSVTLRAAVYDPSVEGVSEIQLWRGQPGGAMITTYLTRVLGQSSMTYTENFTSGTYYYFIRAIQADGHDLWSSPMWITFGAACTPAACDDGNPCTVDACDAGGACTHTPVANGTSCSDGNACNGAETCQAGTCTPGAAPNCDDADPCTTDACDPGTGCTHAPAANGASCSDGDVCNGAETCQSGICTAGAALVCNDGNACTTDACDPSAGCTYTPVTNGTSCADGDACNGAETCQAGTCAAGTPINCSDGNACTTDACEPLTGTCSNTTVPDGTSCADANVCNGAETCQVGLCLTGTPLSCADANACTSDSCDPGLGCVFAPLIDGSSCSDGNACNGAETCQAATCTAGTPPVCNDANPCTSDACDPATGCTNTPLANGTSCSDGNVCNGDETCESGACTAGTSLSCNDGNACTNDTCAPASGCVFTPLVDGSSCGDGDACNGAETCQAGACTSGAPPNCDDANECTTDACDAGSGCTHTNVASGTPCAGGTGTCNGSGTCVPNVAVVFQDTFEGTLAQWTETGNGNTCWFIEAEAEADVPGHGTNNKVAHADGCTQTKRLAMKNAVNVSGYAQVTLSLWRYVDNDLDNNEFLNIQVWNGSSSITLVQWTNGSGDNDTWQQVSYDLTPYKNAALKVRFGAKMSNTAEDVEIDDVRIEAQQ